MFSLARMRRPQPGHADRGRARLYAGAASGAWPASSAHCAAHSRSIIFGRRWITTLRKLPTARPMTAARVTKTVGWARASRGLMGRQEKRLQAFGLQPVHALRVGPGTILQ